MRLCIPQRNVFYYLLEPTILTLLNPPTTVNGICRLLFSRTNDGHIQSPTCHLLRYIDTNLTYNLGKYCFSFRQDSEITLDNLVTSVPKLRYSLTPLSLLFNFSKLQTRPSERNSMVVISNQPIKTLVEELSKHTIIKLAYVSYASDLQSIALEITI